MRDARAWRTALAAVLVAATILTPASGRAEGGFFDFLFGASPSTPAARTPAPREPLRARPPASPVRNSAPRRPVAPMAKPDSVVAVFGDGFATSVARGLNDTDGGSGTRLVLDRSSDDASLVTLDPGTLDKAIAAIRAQSGRLDAAVVMLGGNDGTALADPQGGRQAPGSPGWRQLYGDRIAAVADRFRDAHVPLIWVGLPIVRDAGAAQLYASVNEIVQDRATREGGHFVDAWQPFADENGDFSITGPDVNGRPATLRWTNGSNFTRAGAKKLASFVLPELKRLRDRARSTAELASVPAQNGDVFDQALSIDVNAQILREAGLPAPSVAPLRTQPGPVRLLTAAPLAADGLLASVQPPSGSGSPDRTAHAGRADDFSWPRP